MWWVKLFIDSVMTFAWGWMLACFIADKALNIIYSCVYKHFRYRCCFLYAINFIYFKCHLLQVNMLFVLSYNLCRRGVNDFPIRWETIPTSIKEILFFKKWANSGLFLFIFLLFNHRLCRKNTVGFNRIQTWIVGVEGEHADLLTTTTVHSLGSL